jgi:lipopolysaccharide transport system permease protein
VVIAFATLLATLGVVIRDVQHVLAMATTLWFYLTPVFYDRSRMGATESRYLSWNPMTVLVEAHRAVVLHGRPPDWAALSAVAVAAFGVLGLSFALFRGLEHLLIEEV